MQARPPAANMAAAGAMAHVKQGARALRQLGGLLAELPRAGGAVLAEAARSAPSGALAPHEKAAYLAGQPARVAFFTSLYIASLQLAPPSPGLRTRVAEEVSRKGVRFPTSGELYDSIGLLFARDLRRLERAEYAPPEDLLGPDVLRLARLTSDYLRDLPAIQQRRERGAWREVEAEVEAEQQQAGSKGGASGAVGGAAAGLPKYFTQNFHFQTGGWLSDKSAELYDHQVEVLFTGTADAQRRVAAAGPAGDALRRLAPGAAAEGRSLKLLDVACGTGRFLAHLRASFPEVEMHGLDMSPNYVRKARQTLGDASPGVRVDEGDAAAMTSHADESVDVATCVYLFHELPADVRAATAGELARVVRPGGAVVLADSIQFGDNDGALDALVRFFPEAYHEPYYLQYAKTDLVELFARHGLQHVDTTHAFLTKGMVFVKPVQAEERPIPAIDA